MTRIEVERRRRRWTQIDLAYHARLTNADISRFERGQARPYPTQAKRLSAVLGIGEEHLLDQVDVDDAESELEVRSRRRW
jgi:ribosome-binding protein aMBF1 (putative translation factor)